MSTKKQVVRATTEAFLDRHPVFSRLTFANAHGEPRPSSALVKRLKYLQATRRVVSLERGLYATVRPGADPKAVSPDPYLVASALRPDGVFGYHSALTLLGAAPSTWNVVTVLSHRRRRPLVLRTGRVEVLPHPIQLARRGAMDLGVRNVPYLETTLRVTGPERTLVDGFRQLRLVGGLEEFVASAGGFASLDHDLLHSVLRAYDLRLLYAAVGWFLETYRQHFFVPDAFLSRLEKERPAAPQYLPRRTRTERESGRLVSRWNLVLPEALLRGAEADDALPIGPARPYSFALGKARGRPAVGERPTASDTAGTNARPPQVVVIGGPNGAGKTSSAPRLLRDTVGIDAFVNADVIADGLSAFAPQTSAIEAGRILLARLQELADQRADFAFESRLAGRALYSFLSQLTTNGYQAHILYLWLPSADLAVARVRRRAATGGHDVPEQVIRRRFGRSLANFYRLYRSAATVWRLYDGSVIGRHRLIAHGRRAEDPGVVDAQLWPAVQRQIEEASR
jgi:predicted ABC-type ATPase